MEVGLNLGSATICYTETYHRTKNLPYPRSFNTFRPEEFRPFPAVI